jgi:uncharacterized membrane protein
MAWIIIVFTPLLKTVISLIDFWICSKCTDFFLHE